MFARLPDELIIAIVRASDPRDVASLAATCRWLCSLMYDHTVAKYLRERVFAARNLQCVLDESNDDLILTFDPHLPPRVLYLGQRVQSGAMLFANHRHPGIDLHEYMYKWIGSSRSTNAEPYVDHGRYYNCMLDSAINGRPILLTDTTLSGIFDEDRAILKFRMQDGRRRGGALLSITCDIKLLALEGRRKFSLLFGDSF